MEIENKREEIVRYLNKNYVVKEGRFFTIYDDLHEWGKEISKSLISIFSYELKICEIIFKEWGISKGISEDDWKLAWSSYKLNTSWSPEMVQDLQSYGVESPEEQLTSLLSQALADEIDSQILRELRQLGSIKKVDDFLSIAKCEGYGSSETIYDPDTLKPRK